MARYYVKEESGNDSNDGSQASPWKTMAHAQETAVAGDTAILLTEDNRFISKMNKFDDGESFSWS